jgi:hypothetical protein
MWVTDRPDGRPGTRVAFTLPLLRGGRKATEGSRTRRPAADAGDRRVAGRG